MTARSDVVVVPPLYNYSPEFQAAAAAEHEALGPPCSRDVVIEGCSPVARFVEDYLVTRDRIRHAEAQSGQ